MISFLIVFIFRSLQTLIIIRVFLSYVQHDRRNPVIRFIYDITEPIMAPFRKVLPPINEIDFSPVLVLFVLALVQQLLINIIRYLPM
ncbi:MAG: YggT family protein [Candidatus Saccharibacteria bacterium]